MGYILLHAGIDTRAKSTCWMQFEESKTGIFFIPSIRMGSAMVTSGESPSSRSKLAAVALKSVALGAWQ